MDFLCRRMNYFSLYGMEREYELARKAFAFICEKVRRRQKLNIEDKVVELEIANSLGN